MYSPEPVGEDVRLEARRLVAEALARFGVAGDVEIGPETATLHGPGASVSVECAPLLSDWKDLAFEERRERASEIARRLAQARRRASVVPSTEPSPRWPEWLVPLGVLTLIVVGLFGSYHVYRLYMAGQQTEKSALPELEDIERYEAERRRRRERVCETTESRVMRGAAVGPADVEGWVAELALLSSRDKAAPAKQARLAEFISPGPDGAGGKPGVEGAGRRIIWAGSARLLEPKGPGTGVRVVEASVPNASAPVWRGARIVMSGHYVVPYFREKERIEYVRFARALAEAVDADYGALYARCAHAEAHHLGSWFYGPTPGGAAAALIYFMGTYARALHVRNSVLRPAGGAIDRGHAFRRIASATAPLDKERVRTMLAPYGGMIAGSDEGPFAIRFPFRDANRASRASRGLARELGIGVHR